VNVPVPNTKLFKRETRSRYKGEQTPRYGGEGMGI